MGIFPFRAFIVFLLLGAFSLVMSKWAVDLCLPVRDDSRIFAATLEVPQSLCDRVVQWDIESREMLYDESADPASLPLRLRVLRAFSSLLTAVHLGELNKGLTVVLAKIPADDSAFNQLLAALGAVSLIAAFALRILASLFGRLRRRRVVPADQPFGRGFRARQEFSGVLPKFQTDSSSSPEKDTQ